MRAEPPAGTRAAEYAGVGSSQARTREIEAENARLRHRVTELEVILETLGEAIGGIGANLSTRLSKLATDCSQAVKRS